MCSGGETSDNLKSIGIEKNVTICADGAFTMPCDGLIKKEVDAICKEDAFYNNKVIGVSISSVVEKKCKKMNIDYKAITVEFCNYLIEQGYRVLIIANAAREGSNKARNNDLMICREVYAEIKNKEHARWYDEEMTAEKIRELISHCEILVASRFHAMIAALYTKTPTLLVGWSHKYKEVLDMFHLGSYAVDFSDLNVELLKNGFQNVVDNKHEIIEKIEKYLPTVQESSKNNIKCIAKIIENLQPKKGLFNLNDTDRYTGKKIECKMGY